MRYTLQLSGASPSNNVIKGLHFHVYKKERENWMKAVMASLSTLERVPPIEKAFIRVTRESSGNLDWDNVYGGLKPLLDCLVAPSARNPSGLGLIVDDNPKNMPFPPFVQQLPGKRGAGRTTLEIFELIE